MHQKYVAHVSIHCLQHVFNGKYFDVVIVVSGPFDWLPRILHPQGVFL